MRNDGPADGRTAHAATADNGKRVGDSPSASPTGRAPSGVADDEDSETQREWVGSILALVHGVDHAWQALATHAGCSLNELITLEHLYFVGPVSSPALRRRTGLSGSAITSLIDRLEKRRLVRRIRPAHDRRIVTVELTEPGRRRAEGLFQPLLELLGNFTPDATPPPLAEQLPTIRHLTSYFEHVADAVPTHYRPVPDTSDDA